MQKMLKNKSWFSVNDNQGRASLGVVGQVDERQHGAHDVLALVVVEGEAIRIHLCSTRLS